MAYQPGHTFDHRQRQVDDNAEQGRAQAAFHHLLGWRRSRHNFIVSCSRVRRRVVTVPKVLFFWNPSCPIWTILTKLSLEKAISRCIYPVQPRVRLSWWKARPRPAYRLRRSWKGFRPWRRSLLRFLKLALIFEL